MYEKNAPGSYSEDKYGKEPVNSSGHILKTGKGTTPAKPTNMLEAMKRRSAKSC